MSAPRAESLFEAAGVDPHLLGAGVARIAVHENRLLEARLLPGLEAEVEERADGVEAAIVVRAGTVIPRPVHLCFGVLPEEGLQHIVLRLEMEEGSRASFTAHCTFPNAVRVRHLMEADIRVGAGARYSYFERHVHGPEGGVLAVPRARVTVAEGGRFGTEFELIRGRVGRLEIDYAVRCLAGAVAEMTARISGRGDDFIRVKESARLAGERSRAVLTSYIAVRERARAEVRNTLRAEAAYARGHVDCKEIVQDRARARAVPVVEVRDPRAHVTHEAAIGSVDSKQLETLMSRGLSEEEAVELIIQGLLG